MKTLIFICVLCLLGFLLMLRKGVRDAKNIDLDTPDEHSPEQLDVDEILVNLRELRTVREQLITLEEQRKTLKTNEK